MTRAPIASVVIPARNVAMLLGKQLAGLREHYFEEPFEIIVADNGSTDDTATVAACWEDRLPRLRVVDAGGSARDQLCPDAGVAVAAGEYVLFCDADNEVWVSSGWVRAMVNCLQQVDIAGGKLDLDTLNHLLVRAWRRYLVLQQEIRSTSL